MADKSDYTATAYRAPVKDAESNSLRSGCATNRSDDESGVQDPFAEPLKRQLKSRHLQMIAIGGIIGPGLLVSSGNALHEGGPAGALISFSLVGIIVFFVMIKVIALVVFFILAICISSGGIGPEKIGFRYWHDPGAFADSINGVAKTFVVAGTLYAGTEMVGITAGESKNPQEAVPRAIKQVFWRILIFYIGTIFFIGILIPSNDHRLLGSTSKTASSPLTIALQDAGILPAAHLINALIVISVISAGNSSLYVASRTLLFMSRNGKAPKFIGRANRAGVPWVGLIFTNVFACIVFLGQSSSAGKVYSALITLSGVATFIVWAVIGVCHIRFRRALVAQGEDPAALPYRAALYPYGTYFSLAANIFLVFFQGYTCFLNPFSSTDFVINYILLPVFVLFVVVYKLWNKTRWVKLEEMDIWTGRRDFTEENARPKKPRQWWSRISDIVVG
ncbi:hypothetical protein PoHVEF18_009995 [Penicillium ochrochloron]